MIDHDEKCACMRVEYLPKDVEVPSPYLEGETLPGKADCWKCILCGREFIPKVVADNVAKLAKDAAEQIRSLDRLSTSLLALFVDVQKAMTEAGVPEMTDTKPKPVDNFLARIQWLVEKAAENKR